MHFACCRTDADLRNIHHSKQTFHQSFGLMGSVWWTGSSDRQNTFLGFLYGNPIIFFPLLVFRVGRGWSPWGASFLPQLLGDVVVILILLRLAVIADVVDAQNTTQELFSYKETVLYKVRMTGPDNRRCQQQSFTCKLGKAILGKKNWFRSSII